MHSMKELPQQYMPILCVDLQNDKKKARLVNGAAVAAMVVLAVMGHMQVSIGTLFDMEQGFLVYCLRFVALIAGMFGYIVAHELVHGVFIRIFSGERAKYGFTGIYAFAGSDAYFDKMSYLIIAMAPVVIWGVVLAVLCRLVPESWFWVVWFIQINNLAGAAGDLYVTVKFCTLPADILVQDTGVSMTVYSAQAK